jgi:hypothetical protein
MDTFYLRASRGERIVRFAFSLRRALLEVAARRLAELPTLWGAER